MSDSPPSLDTPWVPEACTLPTADQPLRLAEFEAMFDADVRSVRRVSSSSVELELRPDPAVAAHVAGLAARETACCSFFTFTLTIGDGALVLGVRTPSDYADVLTALAARAETASVTRA